MTFRAFAIINEIDILDPSHVNAVAKQNIVVSATTKYVYSSLAVVRKMTFSGVLGLRPV
jgi:hypothetical protein